MATKSESKASEDTKSELTVLEEAEAYIRNKCRNHFKRLLKDFEKLDFMNAGSVTKEQFVAILARCGGRPCSGLSSLKVINKGDKFIATWTPETINGEENMQGQTISRKGQWDDKSKIERHKKTGKLYMTFWDRDKDRYTTANAEIVSVSANIFQSE